MTTNATFQQLQAALVETNKEYNGNIKFKRLDPVGKRYNFTLTVNSSKNKGGRIGMNGRRIAAACFHSHYSIMENLFKQNPNLKIKSAMESYDGYEDFKVKAANLAYKNIGSQCQHLSFDDACMCGKE
jgi:hypothetical protein